MAGTGGEAAAAGGSGTPPPSPLGFLSCGFAAGLVTTAILHPWDRALYLSVIHNSPFWSRANWASPYSGLAQTLVGRSISSGLYFPLEDFCTGRLGSHVLGGQAAGILNGVLLNPLSLIKYQCWGAQEERRSFMSTARQLYTEAGPQVFCRGLLVTVLRDGIFGFCFALRRSFPSTGEHRSDFAAGVLCAGAGTALSSPFNYLRNIIYAAKPEARLESPRSKYNFVVEALTELLQGARGEGSFLARLLYLQQRFRLGWGTLRVGVGMAMADHVYVACSRLEHGL